MKLTGHRKRKLTLAIHGYGRARQEVGRVLDNPDGQLRSDKVLRHAERAKAHLVAVVNELLGART